jgi:peptidoglycan L-alanyl-D-glutamate endopeptidase CwlK
MKELSQRSLSNLGTCAADLQRLFMEVSKTVSCIVLCGFRHEPIQTDLYNKGLSEKKFPDSKHNVFPSLAVDVIPYDEQTQVPSRERLNFFGGYVLGIASQLGMKINWGPYLIYYDEADVHSPYSHFELTI